MATIAPATHRQHGTTSPAGYNFPSADAAGGDLICAAKSLAGLGWASASVCVARSSLEIAVAELIGEFGLSGEVSARNPFRESLDVLEAEGVICRRFRKDVGSLYSAASQVTHGGSVSLFRAVQLVTIVEEVRAVLCEILRLGGQSHWKPSPELEAMRS